MVQSQMEADNQKTIIKDGWFYEVHQGKQALGIKIKEVLYHKKSKYQDILIFESEAYGTVMVLDGALMLSDVDEHMYHKALTGYGMQNLKGQKNLNVLVIGAGDGGIVRDLVRNYNDQISKITMVEIDEEVINVSKEFFPEVSCEFTNPKAEILCEDAIEFVKNAIDDTYDLVLCDSTDPEGFAAGLIEEGFYKTIKRILKPDGLYVAQSGSPVFQALEHAKTRENLSKVFSHIFSYLAPMTVYPGGTWSYTAASEKPLLEANMDISDFIK